MKKKLFAILCATAVTFGLLTGCGGSQPAATQAAAPAAAETTAAAAAENSTGNTEGVQASPEFYALQRQTTAPETPKASRQAPSSTLRRTLLP